MLPYIVIFILTIILAFLEFGRVKYPQSFFTLYCLAIGAFVGMSDMLGGYDRYIYAEVFSAIADNLHRGNGLFNSTFQSFFSTEPIYGFINSFIGLITPNRYAFIFLYTVGMYGLLSVTIYKFTTKPFFSFLLFLGFLFFFSFTYLRQILACGVCWYAIPYAAKRKLNNFVILVLVASLIHNSAAYFILLYFIPLKKFSKSSIILVMILLFVIGFFSISRYFFYISEDIIDNERFAGYGTRNVLRIEYVIESIVFIAILLYNYSKIKTDNYSLTVLNVYLMFCGTLLFFCTSTDGGRISWYYSIGVFILITEFCQKRKMILLRLFVSTMVFVLYMRILTGWGMLVMPYKTFLTDGFRKGDETYERYEYDHAYDNDKFYNLWDYLKK